MRFKITMREARDVLQLSLLNKAKTEYRSSVLYTVYTTPLFANRKLVHKIQSKFYQAVALSSAQCP